MRAGQDEGDGGLTVDLERRQLLASRGEEEVWGDFCAVAHLFDLDHDKVGVKATGGDERGHAGRAYHNGATVDLQPLAGQFNDAKLRDPLCVHAQTQAGVIAQEQFAIADERSGNGTQAYASRSMQGWQYPANGTIQRVAVIEGQFLSHEAKYQINHSHPRSLSETIRRCMPMQDGQFTTYVGGGPRWADVARRWGVPVQASGAQTAGEWWSGRHGRATCGSNFDASIAISLYDTMPGNIVCAALIGSFFSDEGTAGGERGGFDRGGGRRAGCCRGYDLLLFLLGVLRLCGPGGLVSLTAGTA